MSNISIKAVLLASLAVFGIDIVSQMILINVFGGPGLGAAGASDEEIRLALQTLFQDTRYLTYALIFGTASTILGGYLAARLAGKLPYFNALAFGAFGLTVSLLTAGSLPLWFKIVAFALTLPAALLGGHVAKLQSQQPRS